MQAQMIYKCHTDATEGVSKAGNAWRKVTGIFQTVEHFPKDIAVTGMNSVCEDILKCEHGKLYLVDFDVESRSWTDPKTNAEKWFTDCKACRIQPAVQASAPGIQQQPKAIPANDMKNFNKPLPPLNGDDDPNNDLPF